MSLCMPSVWNICLSWLATQLKQRVWTADVCNSCAWEDYVKDTPSVWHHGEPSLKPELLVHRDYFKHWLSFWNFGHVWYKNPSLRTLFIWKKVTKSERKTPRKCTTFVTEYVLCVHACALHWCVCAQCIWAHACSRECKHILRLPVRGWNWREL